MDEKGFMIRQPGNRESITVIETVGIFKQDIPPMIILKGEKYLYGWYCNPTPTNPYNRHFF